MSLNDVASQGGERTGIATAGAPWWTARCGRGFATDGARNTTASWRT